MHLQAYTTEHPRIGSGPPYPNPLLNFIWFLLLSIQVNCLIELFTWWPLVFFRQARASRSTRYFVRSTSLQLRRTLSIWSIWTRLARYLICYLTEIYFFSSISLECQPQWSQNLAACSLDFLISCCPPWTRRRTKSLKLLVDQAQVEQEQVALQEAEQVPRKHLQLKTWTRVRIWQGVACDSCFSRTTGVHKCSVIFARIHLYTPGDWAAAQPVLIAPLLAEMPGVLPDHHALASLLS